MITKTDITIELPHEFRSANSVLVERATIKRDRMIEILSAAVEADRRERGEPVAFMCTHLSGDKTFVLRKERADPYRSFGWAVEPVYVVPQPADPVKVPSDDEILAWAGEEQFFLFADPEEVLDIVKSALQHFGQPKPSNSGELEPAASAQPVVNQQMTTAVRAAKEQS